MLKEVLMNHEIISNELDERNQVLIEKVEEMEKEIDSKNKEIDSKNKEIENLKNELEFLKGIISNKNKKIKNFIKLDNQQHQKTKLSPSQHLKKVNSKM